MPEAISSAVPFAALRPASARAQSMPRSAIREIMGLAAGRPNVIHLEVGEPDASTPAHIIEGAFEAARAGWTKYSSNAGLPALRQLIARHTSTRWGVEVATDQVVVTTGAIGALYTAIATVVDAGDEILIPDPGWPNYESIAHLLNARAVRFDLPPERGFLPDPDEIASKITAKTKAILFNTPGNPSGAVFPRDIMARLAEIARSRGIYLISDEIYEDIIFDGMHVSAGTFGIADRAFVISGFSKTYAMTGWRLGWVICPPGLASVVTGLQEPLTSCASTIAQKAGEVALSGPADCISLFRDMYRRRRDILVDVFGNSGLLPMVPAGAFYALVDISRTGLGSLDFAKRFLQERDVACVPGITFGPSCDRFVRVAFTIADDQLREGLQRLRDYIGSLAR
ncbi:MAG: pyridoxal phosphate-dependent aminotransferase [Betaproteobacteria bacterium]|nr:pyridoxal phosphate-dependent aminotransferase [Betaproteobacteria bacterium]